MHFGVDIWLFYPRYSVGQAFESVEKAGFKYIEYPYEYFRDYEERELGTRIKEMAEVAQSYSIEPYQLHAPTATYITSSLQATRKSGSGAHTQAGGMGQIRKLDRHARGVAAFLSNGWHPAEYIYRRVACSYSH